MNIIKYKNNRKIKVEYKIEDEIEDEKIDNVIIKFEVYLYNKYKDEKDNKRNDKVGNDVTMKFEIYERIRGGM